MKLSTILLIGLFALLNLSQSDAQKTWETIENDSEQFPRHECSFVEIEGKLFLLGGRGVKPIFIFDTETQKWSQASKPPIELHHFQAVNYQGKLYIAGAMTGKYPYEKAIKNFYIYNPKTDTWKPGPEIPEEARRGGSGLVIYNNKFYVVCGIVNGHHDGFSQRFDEFDPETNTWKQLPDAPRFRDHFHATVVNDKLYAIGGRKTSNITGDVFNLTIPEIDVYDFRTGKWTTLETQLPTPRAGCSAISWNEKIIIAAGESGDQEVAHEEVEVFDTELGTWSVLPSFNRGRHGGQLVLYRNHLYFASGCGNRGGSPELSTMEVLELPLE